MRPLLIAIPVLFWLFGLGGCSSSALLAQLDNHVAVAVDGSRCVSASQWGPLYLGQRINEQQCKAIAEGMAARDKLRAMEAAR